MDCIILKQGDIALADADAVVNAANSGLWEGSGVCGAIFKAAGSSELNQACRAIGHCPVGKAVLTPGFHLKAKYIIHAVGPNMNELRDKQQGALLLASAYRESLLLADQQGCHSIAFPMISTGIYGFPKDKGTAIAFSEIRAFEAKSLEKVILYGYSNSDMEILNRTMNAGQ